MEQAKDQLQAAGLRLLVVGIGQPKHAARYCPEYAPSAECAATPDASAHSAWGMGRGGPSQIAWLPTIQAGVQAAREGYTQGQATGDTLVLGGAFVVDAQGVIKFAHYDAFAGDALPLADILQAA